MPSDHDFQLAVFLLLSVGVIYTTTSGLLGQATLSKRVAQLAHFCPAVVAVWGAFGAWFLPHAGAWAWAAWGALTTHWFVPRPRRVSLSLWAGVALTIAAWITLALFAPRGLALAGMLVITRYTFPQPDTDA